MQQGLTGLRFEIAPKLVGAKQQGHVGWMFEIRLPDDPRGTMARAAIVRRGELLETEHAFSPRGEVCRRRAAHAAETEDDNVVGFHGVETSGTVAKSECFLTKFVN